MNLSGKSNTTSATHSVGRACYDGGLGAGRARLGVEEVLQLALLLREQVRIRRLQHIHLRLPRSHAEKGKDVYK